MSDGLGDARRALRRGDAGETLVHLWNALEQTRGTNDPQTLARIGALAEEVEEEGDEGERAEAQRLLEEVRETAGIATVEAEVDEEWVLPGGEPARGTGHEPPIELPDEPAEEADDEEADAEPQSRGRAALGWLIPIAIFLFLTFRDVFT